MNELTEGTGGSVDAARERKSVHIAHSGYWVRPPTAATALAVVTDPREARAASSSGKATPGTLECAGNDAARGKGGPVGKGGP